MIVLFYAVDRKTIMHILILLKDIGGFMLLKQR